MGKCKEINIELLKEYINKGNTIEQLCFKLECSRSTIYRKAEENDIKLPIYYRKEGKWGEESDRITDITDIGMKNLCSAIIKRAIDDYSLLIHRDKYAMSGDKKMVSKAEIIRFLDSDWCESLIFLADIEITPERIKEELYKNELKQKKRSLAKNANVIRTEMR